MSDDIAHVLAMDSLSPSGSALDQLGEREIEILRQLAAGATAEQIASNLNLSLKTVQNYHYLIKTKTGMQNRRPAGPAGYRVRAGQPLAAGGRRPEARQFSPGPAHTGGFPAFDLLKHGVKNKSAGIRLASRPTRPEFSMIPRYTRPEMASIWEPQTRFKIWFEIEAHAADALAELGVIPTEAAKTIWAKGKNATFDVARIDEIERETKHDVIAFLTHLAEIVGPEARFVHQGMTSSDVLDTCFNVQLTRAADLLISDIDKVLAALKKRAFEHKMTPTIGRSHGIHAEPVTFGLKLAYAYAEFSRARDRLVTARKEVATCAISGAVGTFAADRPARRRACRQGDGAGA